MTQAEPDGHTPLSISGSLATNAATQENLPFDPLTDLQPIGTAAAVQYLVLTGTRVPVTSLDDLVREAQDQTILYGTSGVGGIAHLAGQLLNHALGIGMEAVHYSGGSEAMVDLGGGRLDLLVGAMADLASGIGTPVAMMSETRSAALRAVPSVAEAGYPGAPADGWWGMFAPAGTPEGAVARITRSSQR